MSERVEQAGHRDGPARGGDRDDQVVAGRARQGDVAGVEVGQLQRVVAVSLESVVVVVDGQVAVGLAVDEGVVAVATVDHVVAGAGHEGDVAVGGLQRDVTRAKVQWSGRGIANHLRLGDQLGMVPDRAVGETYLLDAIASRQCELAPDRDGAPCGRDGGHEVAVVGARERQVGGVQVGQPQHVRLVGMPPRGVIVDGERSIRPGVDVSVVAVAAVERVVTSPGDHRQAFVAPVQPHVSVARPHRRVGDQLGMVPNGAVGEDDPLHAIAGGGGEEARDRDTTPCGGNGQDEVVVLGAVQRDAIRRDVGQNERMVEIALEVSMMGLDGQVAVGFGVDEGVCAATAGEGVVARACDERDRPIGRLQCQIVGPGQERDASPGGARNGDRCQGHNRPIRELEQFDAVARVVVVVLGQLPLEEQAIGRAQDLDEQIIAAAEEAKVLDVDARQKRDRVWRPEQVEALIVDRVASVTAAEDVGVRPQTTDQEVVACPTVECVGTIEPL